MSISSRKELRRVLDEANPPCISIYLPTHRSGSETRQDPIRFKNLLETAKGELDAWPSSEEANRARSVLDRAEELLGDSTFWNHQDLGLGLLVGQGEFHTVHLDQSPLELVTVGRRYHVKPLVRLLALECRFHLLALSQSDVRLFEGARDSFEEVTLSDVPTSLEEALGFDFEQKSLQWQSGTSSATGDGGRRAAIFHGQGAGVDEQKNEVSRFFNELDHGIRARLQEPMPSMILAGVEYVTALFREVSEHPKLLEQTIQGNPDEKKPDQLHEEAWSLMASQLDREREEAVARFVNAKGVDRARTDLLQIVEAARHGRVETLFVSTDENVWGTFEESTGRIDIHEARQSGDEDLSNLATCFVIRSSGQVHTMDSGRVPGGGSVAAILRY